MFKNKKGFTLIEIVVVVAVLAVLAAIFVPSLFSSMLDTKEKSDASALENLKITIQIAAQNSDGYKELKKASEESADKSVMLMYQMDNGALKIKEVSIVSEIDGKITNQTDSDLGKDLEKLRIYFDNYINGQLDPIVFESDKYLERENVCYSITFPDVDFKVNVESTKNLKESSFKNAYAGDGVNGARITLGSTMCFGSHEYKDDCFVLKQNGSIHAHTGLGGLDTNSMGDVWKVVLTGENLDNLFLQTTYRETNNNVWYELECDTRIEQTDNSYTLYLTSNVDHPVIAFCFTNTSDEEVSVSNIQFSKVEN